jgi:hypothetical protein
VPTVCLVRVAIAGKLPRLTKSRPNFTAGACYCMLPIHASSTKGRVVHGRAHGRGNTVACSCLPQPKWLASVYTGALSAVSFGCLGIVEPDE